ncbi:MAG: acireductone synthase [Alphaproteobacteria bacterium]|nr:acireductone synthase [Alphaproteobacteria bacterium]
MTHAVLLDIEGTIGDIAFVREVLFPFARARIADVLKAQWSASEVQATVREARAASNEALATPGDAARQFLAWMDADKKITPLKALQGIVWREGYASGELKAHLYPDAIEAMRAWGTRGVKLFIYSSGSIEAQKLYFAHSVAGDLRPLIGGYFDTTTGPKGEAQSYTAIAAAIGFAARAITFFSDAAAETDAALTARLNVYRIDRTKPVGFEGREGRTDVIGSFANVISRVGAP